MSFYVFFCVRSKTLCLPPAMSPVNAAWVQRAAVGLIQLQRQWGMALHVQPLLTRAVLLIPTSPQKARGRYHYAMAGTDLPTWAEEGRVGA